MRSIARVAAGLLLVAGVAGCADGESPGFQNVGGGGGASGDGGAGGDGGASNTSGQATGPTTTTTTAATTTSVTTTTTTTGSTSSSSASSGGGPPCQDIDPGEPQNDAQATAWFLGDLSDDDSDEMTLSGNLREEGDVDWFVYHGVDGFGSTVDPGRQIIGAGIRVCKYLDCDDEEEEDFECPSGTQPDTQGGHAGCCWTGGDAIEWGLGCGSSGLDSDNAKVYMRVDHEGGPQCEAYTLKFNY